MHHHDAAVQEDPPEVGTVRKDPERQEIDEQEVMEHAERAADHQRAPAEQRQAMAAGRSGLRAKRSRPAMESSARLESRRLGQMPSERRPAGPKQFGPADCASLMPIKLETSGLPAG